MGNALLGEVRALVLNVADMDAACRFYADVLGLELSFRDGSRWAQFNAGGFAISLAGGDQRVTSAASAVNVKVADVDAAVVALAAAGVTADRVVRAPHETSASFRDPDGHVFNVYAPQRREANG